MSKPTSLTVDQAIAKAKKAVRLKRYPEAAALYQSVLRQQPDHPVAKKGLRKLERTGRPLSGEPKSSEIDALVARLDAGEFSAVEEACRQKLAAFPRSVLLRNLLGVSLQRCGNPEESIEVFDALLHEHPGFADAHVNRGVALRDAARLADAAAAYEKALSLNPRHALASYNLANVYKDLGEFDKATRKYEQAIDLVPDFAQAHRNLAALRRYEPDDSHFAQMQKSWSRSAGPARAELGFALASVEESFGNYEKSFEYLAEANELRRVELGYRIDEDVHLFERIRACEFESLPPDCCEADDVRPIFIVGMMRSGTSLVEQILASHASVHGGGELEILNRLIVPLLSGSHDGLAFGQHQLAELRSAYLAALRGLGAPERVITDKMPLNFRWLGFILSAFPEARVVHANRDPRATCWSIYKHFFADEGNGYAYSLDNIAAYHGLYLELMSHWRRHFGDRIYELSYESLTEDQEAETRRLLDACGLDWDPACLDFHKTKRAVTTSSAAQVRRQMYTGSSEAWRDYEPYLKGLMKTLNAQSGEH